jgi:hypothetical protein
MPKCWKKLEKNGRHEHKTNYEKIGDFVTIVHHDTNNSQVHEFRQNRGLRSMYHVCPRVYAL